MRRVKRLRVTKRTMKMRTTSLSKHSEYLVLRLEVPPASKLSFEKEKDLF